MAQKIDSALTKPCYVTTVQLETNTDLLNLIADSAECIADLNSRMERIRDTQVP